MFVCLFAIVLPLNLNPLKMEWMDILQWQRNPSNLHLNEWMNHRRHHQMQAAAELAVDPLAASSLILQNQQSETSPFILWCIFGRNTWVMMRTTSFEQFHLNLLLNWQRIVLFFWHNWSESWRINDVNCHKTIFPSISKSLHSPVTYQCISW